MGARANIKIAGWGESIYLYTHWGGLAETAAVVAKTLSSPEGKARINDGPYLARIMFENMIDGAYCKETGYGIWPSLRDNEYPIITVDCAERTVSVGGQGPVKISEVTDWQEWADGVLNPYNAT